MKKSLNRVLIKTRLLSKKSMRQAPHVHATKKHYAFAKIRILLRARRQFSSYAGAIGFLKHFSNTRKIGPEQRKRYEEDISCAVVRNHEFFVCR